MAESANISDVSKMEDDMVNEFLNIKKPEMFIQALGNTE